MRRIGDKINVVFGNVLKICWGVAPYGFKSRSRHHLKRRWNDAGLETMEGRSKTPIGHKIKASNGSQQHKKRTLNYH